MTTPASHGKLNDTERVLREAPVPLSYTKPFWEATRERKLLLQYDPRNGKYQFYPRPVSIYDGRPGLEWRQASGQGEIFTYTIAVRARPPFQGHEPFAIGVVTLEEGVNIMANIVHCTREELRIGLKVKLCWLPLPNGTNLPAFEPAR
jgi:uncharacterized OB-fold protein